MKVRRIDHVGINVHDLPAAVEFFLELGLEEEGRGLVEGDWVDRIVGLRGVRSELAMLRTPDGGTKIELVKFHAPVDEGGTERLLANAPGIRHVTFAVVDLDGILAKLLKKGGELVGEIVNYENVYRLCYLRGPEGIILELAEELD